jgi:hypothetical protein
MSNHKFSYRRYFEIIKNKPKEKQFILRYSKKRICESAWHEEILLEKFQECPICKSQAYHKAIILKITKEELIL